MHVCVCACVVFALKLENLNAPSDTSSTAAQVLAADCLDAVISMQITLNIFTHTHTYSYIH